MIYSRSANNNDNNDNIVTINKIEGMSVQALKECMKENGYDLCYMDINKDCYSYTKKIKDKDDKIILHYICQIRSNISVVIHELSDIDSNEYTIDGGALCIKVSNGKRICFVFGNVLIGDGDVYCSFIQYKQLPISQNQVKRIDNEIKDKDITELTKKDKEKIKDIIKNNYK